MADFGLMGPSNLLQIPMAIHGQRRRTPRRRWSLPRSCGISFHLWRSVSSAAAKAVCLPCPKGHRTTSRDILISTTSRNLSKSWEDMRKNEEHILEEGSSLESQQLCVHYDSGFDSEQSGLLRSSLSGFACSDFAMNPPLIRPVNGLIRS